MVATVNTEEAGESNWNASLAVLLEELSSAQSELLALLATKRDLLSRQDHVALAALGPEEEALSQRLLECQTQRELLLAEANSAGHAGNSLTEAAEQQEGGVPEEQASVLASSAERSQLIRHECLAQWVVVQRTVLHLSQMLEIVASGGQNQPTYGTGAAPKSSGALMDRAV